MAPRGARYTCALRGAMPLRVASTDVLGRIVGRQNTSPGLLQRAELRLELSRDTARNLLQSDTSSLCEALDVCQSSS
jgi:hypothetical protein